MRDKSINILILTVGVYEGDSIKVTSLSDEY